MLLINPMLNALVGLTEPMLGCQNDAYALGCPVLGMALVPPIYIAVMTIILSKGLKVSRALLVVLLSSAVLFVTLILFRGTIANTFSVADNIVTVWVSFAVLAGLLFAAFQRVVDK